MPLQRRNLLSQNQVWVSAPSLSGGSLALLPDQENAVVPGEGRPTWWGALQGPHSQAGSCVRGLWTKS